MNVAKSREKKNKGKPTSHFLDVQSPVESAIPPILENSHSATVSIFYEQVARSLQARSRWYTKVTHICGVLKRFSLGENLVGGFNPSEKY